MEFCNLFSGSKGNCTYVRDGDTRILIDAGMSVKHIRQGLEAIGSSLDAIDAVCFTHDHDDHIRALGVLHRRYPKIGMYATAGEAESICDALKIDDADWTIFGSDNDFPIGSLKIMPFSVSHDTSDPVGYVIEGSDGRRFGIATDLGYAPAMVVEHLRGCNALMLESNHDPRMLMDADRPMLTKNRIRGRQGHLSNSQMADVLDAILPGGLSTLVLSHISEQCNSRSLALDSAIAVLEHHNMLGKVRLLVAEQFEMSPLIQV